MKAIKYFRAQKDTKKFRKNQKVWVVYDTGNHLRIASKWRGKGRLVSGVMCKWTCRFLQLNHNIGPAGFKEIEITDEFYERLMNK